MAALRRYPWPDYWPIVVAYLILFLPTYFSLAMGPWDTPQEGHGPFIVMAALWLAYNYYSADHSDLKRSPALISGSAVLIVGLLMYILGSSQDMLAVETVAQIPIIASCILLLHGWALLRRCWFVLFFMIFIVPMPGWLMDDITSPLKMLLSQLVTDWLYDLGYPISQNGVVIFIAQYQLLVKDACVGLNSLFSLSAVGFFYIYLAKHDNIFHSILLGLFILPVAFFANVVRILFLVLVTYYFGDEVGQGFVHDFSGLVLFTASLFGVFFVDSLISAVRKLPATLQNLQRGAVS